MPTQTQAKVVADSQEARVSTIPRSLSDDYRKKLGELIELTDAQRSRLKGWLKESLNDWKNDTTELHRRLEEDNDLVEGVVIETDFPFENCSNMHVPVTETYMEVYGSVEKRSILGADLLWYGETDMDELKDMLAEVEELMNYKARHEWNIEECLSEVFWTTNRDGLGIIQCIWAEEYEPARDVILLTNEQDFMAELPSPEEAGLSEEEYVNLRDYVKNNATEDMPVEVPITFEKLVYYGCKGEVVELIDFVTFPATVPDIKSKACRGYGKRFYMRKGEIRDKRDDEAFYHDAATRMLNKQGKLNTRNQYTQSKDYVEGLKRSNKDEMEFFELAVRGRLDGNDDEEGERQFLVTYSLENDELLACMEYPYRAPFYALFRINKRPGRLIGKSIPQKTRDMNDEVDTQHNQRINARTISAVPSFKAQLNSKKELDPMLRQNKWRPGGIFWLTDFNTFDQFKVQPVDQGESLAEEQNDYKILDLYLGSAVSLLSGGAAPGDPNAPGNKTAIMIQQSNLRMDDPLKELREGVSELGDICLSHLYQFGPPLMEYQAQVEANGVNGIRESRTLHKKFLRRGIHLQMSGVTVTQNPDAEMQKKFQLYTFLMQEPTFAQNPDARVELLRDALRAGREPGRDRYLPTPQQIEQQQMQMQQKLMMQQELAKAQVAKQQADEAAAANLKAAKTHLDQKSTAEKLAEKSLAMNVADSSVANSSANASAITPQSGGAPASA